MAYFTAAMLHRLRYHKDFSFSIMNGKSIVTKPKPSTVADGIRLNMRDEMSMITRAKAGLHDTRHNRKLKTLGQRSGKCQSIIHQRIELKA